jgi:hypothetical protein
MPIPGMPPPISEAMSCAIGSSAIALAGSTGGCVVPLPIRGVPVVGSLPAPPPRPAPISARMNCSCWTWDHAEGSSAAIEPPTVDDAVDEAARLLSEGADAVEDAVLVAKLGFGRGGASSPTKALRPAERPPTIGSSSTNQISGVIIEHSDILTVMDGSSIFASCRSGQFRQSIAATSQDRFATCLRLFCSGRHIDVDETRRVSR